MPCPPAVAATDAWIPLSLVWPIDSHASLLSIFVRDPRRGFVELKVHPDSGALVGFVIIDLPDPLVSSRRLKVSGVDRLL